MLSVRATSRSRPPAIASTTDGSVGAVTLPAKRVLLDVAGREVAVTKPDKVYFPSAGITKLRLVEYYLAVADAAIRGVARRPQIMKRFVEGIDHEPFFQKRVTGVPP